MCDEIKITKVADDKIEVRTPYNPQFVSKIKTAGARWNAIDKAWTMHAANIDVAREIRDDMPAADEKLVRVRVTALQNISADRGPIVLLGRIIASARGRDSGARVGEGVAFIDGKPQSGGSVKNWTTEISEGSIFVVADVPTTLLGELDETGWRGQKLYRYEIIDDDRDEQLRKLQARREELAAALADIDAQINALKGGN